MKKSTIIISILFLLPYFLLSQDENSSKISHSIGASASMISGHGLSYEIGFNKKHFLEANVFIANSTYNYALDVYNNYEYNNKDILSSYGLEYHYRLFTHKRLSAGLMIGGAYKYDLNEYTYSEVENYNNDKYENTYLSLGGGFLMELYSKSRTWKINLDFGFAYRYHKEVDSGTYYYDPLNDQDREYIDKYFGFAVGGGVYYNFQLKK